VPVAFTVKRSVFFIFHSRFMFENPQKNTAGVARGAPSPKTWIYRDTSYKHLLVETPEV